MVLPRLCISKNASFRTFALTGIKCAKRLIYHEDLGVMQDSSEKLYFLLIAL